MMAALTRRPPEQTLMPPQSMAPRRSRRRRQRPFRDRRRRQKCAATIMAQPLPSPPSLLLPSLMEELVEEILLRLPPHEPLSLVRAALVCKPWHRLVSSARFRRRFLEFHHRTPPMLGFICNYINRGSGFVHEAAAAAAAAPLQGNNLTHCRWWSWCALDARHGRVLLRAPDLRVPVRVLVVWDPITDEQRELPALPCPVLSCTAAIVCAAAATATGACNCNHLGCHRGPFRVVFVGTESGNMFVCTFSSDVGAWSQPISIQRPHVSYTDTICGGYSPSVLLGNELYFGIEKANAAFKYHLGLHDKSWIQLPSLEFGSHSSVLTTTGDGKLGLVRVLDGVLRIWWLRMDAPEANNARWMQFKVIDLKKTLLDVHPYFIPKACVVGFADGLGVVFVTVKDALFTVDLKTYMVKKLVYNGKEMDTDGKEMDTVIPYMRFYSPALEAACIGAEEEPSVAGSSA